MMSQTSDILTLTHTGCETKKERTNKEPGQVKLPGVKKFLNTGSETWKERTRTRFLDDESNLWVFIGCEDEATGMVSWQKSDLRIADLATLETAAPSTSTSASNVKSSWCPGRSVSKKWQWPSNNQVKIFWRNIWKGRQQISVLITCTYSKSPRIANFIYRPHSNVNSMTLNQKDIWMLCAFFHIISPFNEDIGCFFSFDFHTIFLYLTSIYTAMTSIS